MNQIIKSSIALCCFIATCLPAQAQPFKKQKVFTQADTLRGSYGPGRDWWDVQQYELHVAFNLVDSTISGFNIIRFNALKKGERMQIDLQPGLIIDSIVKTPREGKTQLIQGSALEHIGNAYFFAAGDFSKKNGHAITVYYHGKPRIARRPPWDGGLIWKRDERQNQWVSVACQGLGASVWYPCKDHQADEPEGAITYFTVPDTLVCVSNGRFGGKKINGDGTATYNWVVKSRINNYNIVPYIGKYVHFGEVYPGEKGKLDMDYWVLDYNLEKAKKQFTDAGRMMKALEHWFGPYPFYKDGYKLVESPHLGMEHQSAIAYGNKYQNGYSGRDLSATGWGMKWDFIIIHESGHEWFANNITTKELADMWVHEGFTNYSETLFTDYHYGKAAGNAYVTGTRKLIQNDIPIIGIYGVNQEGSGDMYYKAGNMLHTIRQVINNDEKFRKILRGLGKTFYQQTVTTGQVEAYISKQAKIDFSKFFDQYLRTIRIPVLEYKINGHQLMYRYTNTVDGFDLPLKIHFKTDQWIRPTASWKTLNLYPEGSTDFSVDPNFYIETKKIE